MNAIDLSPLFALIIILEFWRERKIEIDHERYIKIKFPVVPASVFNELENEVNKSISKKLFELIESKTDCR